MRTKNDNINHNVFQAIFFKVTEDPHVNLKCLNHFQRVFHLITKVER